MTELHEDLKKYISFDERLMCPVLKHPLVFSIPYIRESNNYYNTLFNKKYNNVKNYILNKEYKKVVLLYEKPYRVNVLLNHYKSMDDFEYWNLLREIWLSSEFPYNQMIYWLKLFNANKKDKDQFMTENDKKIYGSLPDEFIVYRGYKTKQYKNGISYTLDYKIADWFSRRFGKRGKVQAIKVFKKDIFAYLGGKNEEEIIYLKNVNGV